MIRAVTEFFVDDAALAWLESLGYTVPTLGSENCSPSEKITGKSFWRSAGGNRCKKCNSSNRSNMQEMHSAPARQLQRIIRRFGKLRRAMGTS
jgi:hypothetical protein